MRDLALYIFMRSDLNMSRGKIAVQAGHATALVMMKENQETIQEWMLNAQIKIVLVVNSLEEIEDLELECIKRNLKYAIVHDAGRTEIEPDTITCMGVGLESRKRLNKLAKGYKSLN